MYDINLAQWVKRLGVLHIFSIEVLLHFAETLYMCMQNERDYLTLDTRSVVETLYMCMQNERTKTYYTIMLNRKHYICVCKMRDLQMILRALLMR